MSRENSVVCWDRDGVLARVSERRQALLPDVLARKMTWLEWSSLCDEDAPIYASKCLMWMLAPHYRQVVLSAATRCPQAISWLRRHDFPFDEYRMREPGDDDTSDAWLKLVWVRGLRHQDYRIAMFFEDKPDVAEALRAEGVPVTLINPGYVANGSH